MNIIRGQTKPFVLKIRGKLSGNPHDFTGATEIVAAFPLAGGGTLNKTLTGSGTAGLSYPVSPLLGAIAGTITSTETPTLDVGQGQSVKVTETKPSGVSVWEGQILNVSD